MRKASFRIALSLAAIIPAFGIATSAHADAIPYPTPGTENPFVYTFTATATGDVVGSYVGNGSEYGGTGALLDAQIEMLINGVASPNGFGLDNQTSTVGQAFNFGAVVAGDTLTFVDNAGPDHVWSSNIAQNPDGATHVYATLASPGAVYPSSPSGIYIGFEDSPKGNTDFNYADTEFIVQNVAISAAVAAVPEPSTWAMLLVGFAGLGLSAHRRKLKRTWKPA